MHIFEKIHAEQLQADLRWFAVLEETLAEVKLGSIPSWHDRPESLDILRELESLLRTVSRIPNVARHHWESVWELIRPSPEGEVVPFNEDKSIPLVRGARELNQQGLRILRSVEELIATFLHAGYSPRGAMEIRQMTLDLEKFDQETFAHWDNFSEQDVELANGLAEDLEDAFASIAGVSKDEWRDRIRLHLEAKSSKDGEE